MKTRLLFCFIIFTLCFCVKNASATTTYTWTGATSSSWNVTGNWTSSPSGGSFPKAGDIAQIGVITFAGSQPAINATGLTCTTLTIGSAKSVTLTISNPFTVSGAITTSTASTTITGTSTLSAATLTTSGPLILSTTGGVTITGIFTASGSSSTITSAIGTTITADSLAIDAGIYTFNGKLTLIGGMATTSSLDSIATNAAGNTIGSAITPSGDLTWNGSGSTTVNGNMNFSKKYNFIIGKLNTLTFTAGTIISFGFDILGLQSTFTNNGTLICTGCSVLLVGKNHNTLINNGIITASGTASVPAVFTTSGAQSTFTNNTTGVFNAGLSNLPCQINLSKTDFENYGTFNMGSASIITSSSGVTNNSPGVFTLLSDQYGSASIGQSSGTFIGTFNVQRYLSGGSTSYRSYHLLSSPVNLTSTTGGGNIGIGYINTNQTVVNANATTGTTTYYGALTGGSGTGFTVTNANPSLYVYNESLPSSNASFVSGKYEGIVKVSAATVDVISGTTTTTGKSIPAGNGFLVYFIGNNNSTVTKNTRVPEATTITATGDLNQSNVSVKLWWSGLTSLSYTAAYAPNAGFNLVGNPYASVIDLKKVYSDNGSFTTFYELNDINPSQGYVSYNGKDSTKSSSKYSSRWIASGQGFIVKATATGQTFTFNEDQKVYSTSGILNSSSSPPILLSLRTYALKTNRIRPAGGISGLHLMLQHDTANYRECGIYFNSKYADNYDEHDAYDLDGFGLKVFMSSFTSDGIRTGINALGDYTKGKRVKIFVKATTDGVYNLKLEDIQNIDTSAFNIYLVDNLKNDSLDIVRYKSYAFDLHTADTASFANRFVLAVERKPMPPYQLISFTGQKVNSGVQINWTTYNEGNYTGFVLQKQQGGGSFAQLDSLQGNGAATYSYVDKNPVTGPNVYRLLQDDINGRITYSAPVTITYNNTSAAGAFSVYPNPARELITISVNSATAAAPNYISNIYNTAGELIGHRAVSGNTWTEDITAYKAGLYIIELKGNDGNLVGKSKFVKTN